MTAEAPSASQRAAASYLRELLLKPGAYRDEWQRYVARPREGVINQMAVAEVIARSLRSSPGHAGDAMVMPYQLRELVANALSGRFSRETMQLFIDAFGLASHEAERLGRLYLGSTRIRVLTGTSVVSVHAERELADVLGPRRHQTLSMHDHVYIGADRRIDRARSFHVIEAIEEKVDRFPIIVDTNVLTVEVGQGGTELVPEVRQVGDDLFYTEILLARALELGETITLEYWATYRFPGNSSDPGEREFRRAAMHQSQNFTMRVEFAPQMLPAHVWWAHWDGVDGDIVQEELVTLDKENSAHRFLHSLDRAVAGFRWSWD